MSDGRSEVNKTWYQKRQKSSAGAVFTLPYSGVLHI